MPIFEYTCNVCRRGKFSVLVGVIANAPAPACPRCGGVDITKAVSRFARVRSEDEALESLAEQADNADFDDTRAVRRLVRDMASEMGDSADADEFERYLDDAGDTSGGDGSASDTPDL
jgi:putative FmdB family regulatory protein